MFAGYDVWRKNVSAHQYAECDIDTQHELGIDTNFNYLRAYNHNLTPYQAAMQSLLGLYSAE